MNSPWPRSLPITLIWDLFCGGQIKLFGWFFILIGGSLSHFFIMRADLDTTPFGVRENQGWYVTVGQIQDWHTTSASINKQAVKRYQIQFTDGQGTSRNFEGYSLSFIEINTEIAVEYQMEAKSIPRAEGMTRAPFGPLVLITLIFPIIGFGFVLFGFPSRWRFMRLLSHGDLVEGKFIWNDQALSQINTKGYVLAYVDPRGEQHYFHTHLMESFSPDDFEELNKLDRQISIVDPPAPIEVSTLFLSRSSHVHSHEAVWLPTHRFLKDQRDLWWDGRQFHFRVQDPTKKLSVMIVFLVLTINTLIHYYA